MDTEKQSSSTELIILKIREERSILLSASPWKGMEHEILGTEYIQGTNCCDLFFYRRNPHNYHPHSLPMHVSTISMDHDSSSPSEGNSNSNSNKRHLLLWGKWEGNGLWSGVLYSDLSRCHPPARLLRHNRRVYFWGHLCPCLGKKKCQEESRNGQPNEEKHARWS